MDEHIAALKADINAQKKMIQPTTTGEERFYQGYVAMKKVPCIPFRCIRSQRPAWGAAPVQEYAREAAFILKINVQFTIIQNVSTVWRARSPVRRLQSNWHV